MPAAAAWRLLFVIKASALNRGMNTGIENLAWKLAGHGLEIHVSSGGSTPIEQKREVPQGVAYHFTGGDGMPGDHADLYRELCSTLEFDAVIGWIRNRAPLALLEQAGSQRPRFIANEGDISAPRRQSWKRRARVLLAAVVRGEQSIAGAWHGSKAGTERISGVGAVARPVQDSVVRAWGIPRERTTVIPRGIATAFFQPLPSTDYAALQRPPRLLYTGNIIESKGVGDIVEALQEVATPVELVLCGNEKGYLAHLHQRPAEIGGGHKLTWAGALPPEALLGQLQRADIFLFCSWGVTEGLPKSLSEAMACALPVVVSDFEAFADVVTDRENGLVVPLPDARRIAAAISAYLADPVLRARCGQNARRTIEARFSAAAETEAWLAYLARQLDAPCSTDRSG